MPGRPFEIIYAPPSFFPTGLPPVSTSSSPSSLSVVTTPSSSVSVSDSMGSSPSVPNINLTDTLKEDIFTRRKNIFLSGQAGTGKSRLLKDIKIYAEETYHWKVAIVSTTGVSAISVGGTTIHSWSGIRLGTEPVDTIVKRIRYKNKECAERWQACDLLLVDEVSMLGSKTFELISQVGCLIRRTPHHPFGGLQVVFTGDFLQLPPINDAYAFESSLWNELEFNCVTLYHPYRFPDQSHFYMLTRIRLGTLLPSDIKRLKQREEAYTKYLNTNQDEKEEIKPTKLHSLKRDVEFENHIELEKLPAPDRLYKCKDTYKRWDKTPLSEYEKKSYTDFLNSVVPAVLILKVGAQVMLTYNLSIEMELVNGSRGVVKQCEEDGVRVLFRNGLIVKIPYHDYEFEDGKAKYIRYQIPLILAWTLTINKSQGSTLDYAIIDIGPSIFAPSMAYVALSRVKTLQGLFISSFSPEKIFCSESALSFEKKMNEEKVLIL